MERNCYLSRWSCECNLHLLAKWHETQLCTPVPVSCLVKVYLGCRSRSAESQATHQNYQTHIYMEKILCTGESLNTLPSLLLNTYSYLNSLSNIPSHQQAGVPTEIFRSKFSYVCVRNFFTNIKLSDFSDDVLWCTNCSGCLRKKGS